MDNAIGGFIFSILFLLVCFGIWVWVIFGNGAKAWSNTSMEFQKRIWRPFFSSKNIENKFRYVLHPMVSKITASVMFGLALFAVYIAVTKIP